MFKIVVYRKITGKVPFSMWQKKLDPRVRSIIRSRLARVRQGNLGDCTPIKGSSRISELRIDFGPGYRVYYAKQGSVIIVLLTGGDKGSQDQDIEKAKLFWQDYQDRGLDDEYED